MENKDTPAYPEQTHSNFNPRDDSYVHHNRGGLTKRERFAMAAMQGILSNPMVEIGDSSWPTWLEYTAIRIADSQLKSLEE